MTETFGEHPSSPIKFQRPTYIYSESEIGHCEDTSQPECEPESLTFGNEGGECFHSKWNNTKNGPVHKSRPLFRQEFGEKMLEEYDINSDNTDNNGSRSNSSSRITSSNDHKRKRRISSVGSNSNKRDGLSSAKATIKKNDFDAIMDDTSSLSSNSMSDKDNNDQEPTATADISGSNKCHATNCTQSRLPSFVLDIKPEELVFEEPLGEGQTASVVLANYRNLPVACKVRRECKRRKEYESNVSRELRYSAKLSACRFMNPCIGVLRCSQQKIRSSIRRARSVSYKEDLYVIQRYYENGDLREYITKRQGTNLHQTEVLQIALSLFAGLSDAHKLDVGIVDLKLENILVDVVGSAWFTDFGSCIDFKGKQVIMLDETNVKWTEDVAAPEMLRYKQFSKESDVFMCAIILAEIMTPSLNDEQFARDILGRDKDGSVAFKKENIDPMYHSFTQLLGKALSNEPMDRPTADNVYKWLLDIRRSSMEHACKQNGK